MERDSQKAIVIGKRGAMLKTIGTDARKAIERLLGTHVYLASGSRWSRAGARPSAGSRKLGYEHVK